MSLGQLATHRSSSSGSKSRPQISALSAKENVFEEEQRLPDFQPCAATASIFLFAQGKTILCLHHDTLAVERRFEKHKQRVVLLSVDNVSERGAGRLVVSYDAEQTAIVWDLFTGDEITRFASFDPLRVATWMKNGNIAFGNSQGHVMLFEPSTSEHRSARTIFDPITAIAPAADCQTYAIGYQNGSILIASLLPNFTILHTLSTPRAPSAIVGLAWHASSSKQKSDMLAVQSADGDLRVWSIAKPAGADVPKVIRVLKRGDSVESGLSWISWSKNGRILQFSLGETWAWDVRTKHVAYEPVPTVDGVVGLANFGPGAILFTLGPNHSVQQYDLSPPQLVKNLRHDPNNPSSMASTPKINQHKIPGAAPPLPIYKSIDPPRGAASLSTIQRATNEMQSIEHARALRKDVGSPLSSAASRTESTSSRSSTGRREYRAPSVSSRAASGTTFSTMSPSLARDSTASSYWPGTASVSSSRRSKGSRLRQEVLHSPEGGIVDLFPYTRARLANLPYAPQPPVLDQTSASSEELRRQMLEVVFGWQGDIEPMIRDEMNRHPTGSMNATLLSKWLGEVQVDMMSMMGSDAPSSNDWMLLALSSMGGQGAAGQQLARTFSQRLLSQNDIHTAATVLLGIKDFEEAVDIYTSRNYYMEAILLTCLLFPDEWQRQAHLVRRWGEYVVENSQQHLAIRCFSCTGTDTSLPWASPTQSPFSGTLSAPSLPQTLSPPNSPPPPQAVDNKPARMTTKNSSLKLITTFGPGPGDKNSFRFPGLKTDDRTPTNAPGVTPIAESALSPGGTPVSYMRPRRGSKTPGGSGRSRLPSIGETPIDVKPPSFPVVKPIALPTPNDSGSDAEKDATKLSQIKQADDAPKMIEDAALTLSSAKYDPKEEPTPHATPQTAIPSSAAKKTLLSKSELNAFNAAQERTQTRNGSRDRKPNGLQIQMPLLSQLNLNAVATGSTVEHDRYGRRRSHGSLSLHSSSGGSGRVDMRHDNLSPPVTGRSWTSSTKSPSTSGRSIDPYISSLEEASFYSQQKKEKKQSARSREGRSEKKSRSRHREPSADRGRTGQRYIRPAKRSPSSPVPMSPEDLQQYREAHSQSIASIVSRNSSPEDKQRLQSSSRRKGASKNRSASKYSELSHSTTVRHISPEPRQAFEPVTAHKSRSRAGSRKQSPTGFLSPVDGRGRSRSSRGGSVSRSPSSPLPMSKQPDSYRQETDESEGPMRLVEANRQRLRSTHRSTSRKPRGQSTTRAEQPDRRTMVDDLPPQQQQQQQEPTVLSEKPLRESPKSSDVEKGGSDSNVPRMSRTKSHRSLKKEMAARELEARRESLTARTMAAVTKPNTMYSRPSMGARSQSDLSSTGQQSPPNQWRPFASPDSNSGYSENDHLPADFSPPERTSSAGPFGLPSTPRAMRHPRYNSRDEDIPAVPELPDAFYATGQPMFEPSRSMSAPVPEPEVVVPSDMPTHPAFHRGLRPSSKRPNFSPLNEIGKHRRTNSTEAATLTSPPIIASIGETLHASSYGGEAPIIDVPVSSNTPPAVIPELAHLAGPPPPPPPPPPFSQEHAHHSLSSGSGVGTINILMDDVASVKGSTPVPLPENPSSSRRPSAAGSTAAVAAAATAATSPLTLNNPLPPMPPMPPMPLSDPPNSGSNISSGGAKSPPPGDGNGNGNGNGSSGHRRGRSIDHIGGKFGRIAERMRSSSRGRNNQGGGGGGGAGQAGKEARSPKQVEVLGPSPYETRVEGGSYF